MQAIAPAMAPHTVERSRRTRTQRPWLAHLPTISHLAVVAAWAALAAGLAAQTAVKEIKGRIVDGDGTPVAGVPVAAFWTIKEQAWTPGGPLLATSDGEGAFAKKVLWSGQPTAYFALDSSATRRSPPASDRGAIVVLDDASVEMPQQLVLVPLVAVEATFDFAQCGQPVSLLVSLMARPARTYVGQLQSTGDQLRLRLPPGDYALRTFARDAVTFERAFTVPSGQARVDLGALPIEPSVIARHYGKEPPALGVTETRGVGADFKLADLKGKWVLIDFWGHW